MLIIPEKGACFVCVPKTGTQAMTRYLETALRNDESMVYEVERMHDNHATIAEVEAEQALPFSLYDAWSFAFIRNPFDRLVSHCAKSYPDFLEAPRDAIRDALTRVMQGEENRWMLPQVYFTAGVKALYRFERMEEGFAAIKQRLGIEDDSPLPKINESQRDRYAAYFDNDLKSLAEFVYADDLREFSYGF